MSAIEFEVFTIFPGAVEAFVSAGIMAKAIERDQLAVRCTDFRDFTHDRHRSVDDTPFGGGAGMVIKPEPVVAALEAVVAERGAMHTILLTPSGARFDQRVAERLARCDRIALLCGRYEGIDDRVREHYVDECLSIGDFVLNGGEVAAAVIIEAVARLREGVLGNPDSIAHESFASDPDADEDAAAWSPGLVLEHPHYTRPAEFRGHAVPAVLLAGDHGAVERWRRRSACLRTWALRPSLRPRWRLAVDHPICLAADASDPTLAQLAALARDAGVELVTIGRPPHEAISGVTSNMRDLKQLRRSLRKRHDREPWLLGVGDAETPEQARGPRVVLDVLAFEHQQPPPPLIVWLGGPDHAAVERQAPLAWLALVENPTSMRLAIASGLIDISQPQPARRGAADLARATLAAMRAEALLRPQAPE